MLMEEMQHGSCTRTSQHTDPNASLTEKAQLCWYETTVWHSKHSSLKVQAKDKQHNRTRSRDVQRCGFSAIGFGGSEAPCTPNHTPQTYTFFSAEVWGGGWFSNKHHAFWTGVEQSFGMQVKKRAENVNPDGWGWGWCWWWWSRYF